MHNGSNNIVTLRYRLKDIKIRAAEQGFKAGDGTPIPRARFSFPSPPARSPAFREKSSVSKLTAAALAAAPDVPAHDMDIPRIAIYSTWNKYPGRRMGSLRLRPVRDSL